MMSFNKKVKTFNDFYQDFLENYFSHINPIFITQNNNIIGYIGFTQENTKFYFNIIISKILDQKN